MERSEGTGGRRISSDRETISGWAEEHDVVPARHRGSDGTPDRVRIVPRDHLTDDHEELTWEEFHDELERRDEVVAYGGTERDGPFEVTGRDAAVRGSPLDDQEAEDALFEGETVTTGPTGTTAGADANADETDPVVALSETDEGKTVVDAAGDDVGVVVDVEDGTVYVDPDPSLSDRFRSVLGWSDADEDGSRPIAAERIERISDGYVELVDEAEIGKGR